MITLYRGDSIFNSTEPGRYRFDGIRSKSFGKGNPQYIEPSGLLDNIRKHIKPISKQDWNIYNRTEFISFSTDLNRALYWLTDCETKTLKNQLADYQETRYLFKLNIQENLLESLDEGNTMFMYRFQCNPRLKRFNSDSVLEQAVFSVTANNTFFKSCPVCDVNDNHAIVLIDTVKYLRVYQTGAKYQGAINNAVADKEWLILPNDPISNFSGTTIPRADFWTAEHYVTDGETRPPNFDAILGMAYDDDGNAI